MRHALALFLLLRHAQTQRCTSLAGPDCEIINGRAPALIADLEDALAALPMLQKPPKDGDKGQTLRVEGALMAATVKLSPAPAPYLLLVADEGDDAPEGYRRLAHCGYAAECAVRPLAAASPPA